MIQKCIIRIWKKRAPLTLPPFFIFYPRLLLSSLLFRFLHIPFSTPPPLPFPIPPILPLGSRPQPHLPHPLSPFSQPLSHTPPPPPKKWKGDQFALTTFNPSSVHWPWSKTSVARNLPVCGRESDPNGLFGLGKDILCSGPVCLRRLCRRRRLGRIYHLLMKALVELQGGSVTTAFPDVNATYLGERKKSHYNLYKYICIFFRTFLLFF